MGLTLNRSLYTFTELNDYFGMAKVAIGETLPSGVRVDSAGVAFEDIDINESDDIAGDIETPEDLLEAIASLGSPGRDIYIDVKTDNLAGAAITTFVNVYGTSGEIPRDMRDFNFANIEETSMQQLVFSNKATSYIGNPFSTTSNLFAQITFSGLSTISLSRFISNSTNGWFSDNFFGGEQYNGAGIEFWGVSALTNGLVGTTFSTIYLYSSGIGQWTNQKKYGLTEEDNWGGFPEGISPSSGDSKCSSVEEDLSTQVDGTATTFSTSREFVSDCLHVYWNGQRLRKGVEFNVINSTQFTTTFTPTLGTSIFVDLVEVN